MSRAPRKAASGLTVAARLALVGVVATAPSLITSVRSPARDPVVRPAASVLTQRAAVARLKLPFAVPSVTAPPPAAVSAPGPLGIPAVAMAAYRNAERVMAKDMPGCGVSWNLLAGIGRIESMHAFGGATDIRGTAIKEIFGPTLDGSLPGNEVIVQSTVDGHTVYARAMGPMQFLPQTWARYLADGDGDGQADPQNLFDAALAAARYLCSGGLNLRDQSQVITAVLRYNNSMAYTRNVLGWSAGYATGVAPVDLPPITGPSRPAAVYVPTYAPEVVLADSGPGSAGAEDAPSRNAGIGTDSVEPGGNGGAANATNGAGTGVRVGDGRNGTARGAGGDSDGGGGLSTVGSGRTPGSGAGASGSSGGSRGSMSPARGRGAGDGD